jgi:hypothetical protein
MEFRIYYESMEQALHFLEEDIKKEYPNDNFILVKKSQQSKLKNGFSKKYSKNLSKILIKKNPDLVITAIKDNIEYPICVIEFSTAVFTKDHEQQRSDNFLIPIRNNTIYVKVSSTKKDSGNHGGDTKYNPIEPFSLCYKQYNKLCFHIEWETELENKKYVQKHKTFKSIPNSNENFILLISTFISCFKNSGLDFIESVKEQVKKIPYFDNWIKRLEAFNEFENISKINSKRTEWFDKYDKLGFGNTFVLKFNRMGHAMDPERGMLTHYGTFFKTKNVKFISKLVFDPLIRSWYKQTSNEKKIEEIINENPTLSKSNLLEFLCYGLSLPDTKYLINLIQESRSNTIDISDYISNNYENFNTPFRTIIEFSNALHISSNSETEIFLIWKDTFYDFNYDELPENTELTERTSISEDDITYITMNSVFSLNEIKPISVSYPGAQSDTPILPQTHLGRSQERTYIDSVGWKNNILVIQENKGAFKAKEVISDINKIIKFKAEENYKDAIYKFAIEQNSVYKELVIGVGFGYSKAYPSQISECQIDLVDYFVIVDEKLKGWKVFSNINDDIFRIKSATISLPKTYEVV